MLCVLAVSIRRRRPVLDGSLHRAVVSYVEPSPVGEHAPYPLQRTETEEAQPHAAESHLEQIDTGDYQFGVHESETCAQTKADAVEQQRADDRLAYVVGERHAAGIGEPAPYGEVIVSEIHEAHAAHIGKAERIYADGVDGCVDGVA